MGLHGSNDALDARLLHDCYLRMHWHVHACMLLFRGGAGESMVCAHTPSHACNLMEFLVLRSELSGRVEDGKNLHKPDYSQW